MSFDIPKDLDLDSMTVKSLIELLDALDGVNEDDPANDQNEFTISDNNGGTIELGLVRGKDAKVITIRREALKLTLSVDAKPKRIIRLVLKDKD